MSKGNLKTILIKQDVYDTLTTLRHPGQSYGGVIEEILTAYQKYHAMPTQPDSTDKTDWSKY